MERIRRMLRALRNDLELEKKKTPRVLARSDDPAEIAKMHSAESGSSMRPNGDDQMKIYVQSEYYGNYLLEVDSSNTIQDVLVTVLPKQQEATALYFNGNLLERAKSLADYSIEDGSILHLEQCCLLSLEPNMREMPQVIPERKRLRIIDQSSAIWENEHDKVLLSLLGKETSNGRRDNILHPRKDSWCNIVAEFNKSTGLKYEYKDLLERFRIYKRRWNDYIKQKNDAGPHGSEPIPYIDMLKVVFADEK